MNRRNRPPGRLYDPQPRRETADGWQAPVPPPTGSGGIEAVSVYGGCACRKAGPGKNSARPETCPGFVRRPGSRRPKLSGAALRHTILAAVVRVHFFFRSKLGAGGLQGFASALTPGGAATGLAQPVGRRPETKPARPSHKATPPPQRARNSSEEPARRSLPPAMPDAERSLPG